MGVVKTRQIVDAGQRIGVVFAKQALERLQGAPEERLGFRIPALTGVKRRKVVDAYKRIGMLFAVHTLAHLQGALV